MDAVGLCRVEYSESGGQISRSKDFNECIYEPEKDFDFFNPYETLGKNWFGKSNQKCDFNGDLRSIACFEEHRFDNGDLDVETDALQTDPENGVISIWTRLERKSGNAANLPDTPIDPKPKFKKIVAKTVFFRPKFLFFFVWSKISFLFGQIFLSEPKIPCFLLAK